MSKHKYKKLNSLLVLLGCMLGFHGSCAVASDNTNYGSVKIQSIFFLNKVMANGNSISCNGYDIDDDREYKIVIPSNGCSNPRLTLSDKNDNKYEVKYYGPRSVAEDEKFEIHAGTFTKNDNIFPVHYAIVLDGTDQITGNQCATQEGDMPEIQVALVNIPDAKDGSKKLRIKNISPQTIKITDIAGSESNSAINVVFSDTISDTISLDSGKFYDVVLKPGNICTSKNQKKVFGPYELIVSYSYKADNGQEISSSKFGIYINYSCDWERERTSAELKAALDALAAAKKNATTTSATELTQLKTVSPEIATDTSNVKIVDDITGKIKTVNDNVEKAAARIKNYDLNASDSKKSVSDYLVEFDYKQLDPLNKEIQNYIDKSGINVIKEELDLYYDKIVKPLVDRVEELKKDFAALQGINYNVITVFRSEFKKMQSATSENPARAKKDIQSLSTKLMQAKLLAQQTKKALIIDPLLANVKFNDTEFDKDIAALDKLIAEVDAFK